MNVFVILNSGVGASLGTNFTLSANVGGAPIPATATLQELLDQEITILFIEPFILVKLNF